ncbi:hypothetical protein B1987_13595 [Mycobacterium kansasii]|nr:hypothetical protein B1987_13595 [Mycobacterium kansasii]
MCLEFMCVEFMCVVLFGWICPANLTVRRGWLGIEPTLTHAAALRLDITGQRFDICGQRTPPPGLIAPSHPTRLTGNREIATMVVVFALTTTLAAIGTPPEQRSGPTR